MIVEVILLLIQVLTIAIVLRIIVSWVVMLVGSMRWLAYSPAVQILNSITDPILIPIRSVMPNLGGFDFSPMIAIFILQIIARTVAGSA